MSTELVELIAERAAAWELGAPPITAEEIRAHRSATVAVLAARPRRRRLPVLVVAVIAVAAAVAAIVVVTHDPRHRTVTPTGSELGTVPLDTVTPTTLTPTTVTPTIVTPATDDEQLAVIASAVNDRLSTLQSFRGVARVTTSQQPADGSSSGEPTNVTTRTNTVTVMADGSLWSEGTQFQWSSYDATTGTSRVALTAQDGSTAYQEVVGWTDNSTPLNILIGYDPVMQFSGLSAPIVSEVNSHLGRRAWQITSTSEIGPAGSGSMFQTETYTIDEQTGLVIAKEQHQLSEDGVDHVTNASLHELTTDVTLPPAFPGSFPDGASVDRSGDPNAFTFLTVEAAAAQFGQGFVVPAGHSTDLRITAVDQQTVAFPATVEIRFVQVTLQLRTGFVTSSITMSKQLPVDPGQPTPSDMALVDGMWCWSQDGAHCIGWDAPSEITAGALMGMPTSVEGALGNMLTISNGPVQVAVSAPTKLAALALANSLTTIEG